MARRRTELPLVRGPGLLRLLGKCHSGPSSTSRAMASQRLRTEGESFKALVSMSSSRHMGRPSSGDGEGGSRSQALLKTFREELGGRPQEHFGTQVYYCDLVLAVEDVELLLETLESAANADAERG